MVCWSGPRTATDTVDTGSRRSLVTASGQSDHAGEQHRHDRAQAVWDTACPTDAGLLFAGGLTTDHVSHLPVYCQVTWVTYCYTHLRCRFALTDALEQDFEEGAVEMKATTARTLRAGWKRRRRFAFAVLAAAFPVAAAGATTPNVVSNGSFTAGLAHWSKKVVSRGQNGAGYPRIAVGALNSTANGETWSWMQKCARSQGSRPFAFIDAPGGADGYIQQQLKVPRSPGKLKFRTWGNLQPTQVTVSIVAHGQVHRVQTYSPPALQGNRANGCSGKRPVTKSVNVLAYAGKTVRLRIEATSTGFAGTIADFDGFSLKRR